MHDSQCPDPRTDSLEFMKYAVGRHAQPSFLWETTTLGLCLQLPEGPPHFLFTPDTTLPTHDLESVLGGPVILLDSRMDDEPQLIHTFQLNDLMSNRLENPALVSQTLVVEPYYYKPTEAEANANPTAALFRATRELIDMVLVPEEYRSLALAALLAPETIFLVAKAVRLQNYAYTYAPQAENRAEKLEVPSDFQMYRIFFAFIEFTFKIRPERTYNWLETVFTSLAGAAGRAANYIVRTKAQEGGLSAQMY